MGNNTEKLLYFPSCWVAESDAGWWSLLESWPQPGHSYTRSGMGKPSTKWLWSVPGPGNTLVTLPGPLPRLSVSHGKSSRAQARIHWRWWQGLHWFHTPWLRHALASDTRIINLTFSITSSAIRKGSRRLKNEAPSGAEKQSARLPGGVWSSVTHPAQHLCYHRDTQHFAAILAV